jgi:hypothetical protein
MSDIELIVPGMTEPPAATMSPSPWTRTAATIPTPSSPRRPAAVALVLAVVPRALERPGRVAHPLTGRL